MEKSPFENPSIRLVRRDAWGLFGAHGEVRAPDRTQKLSEKGYGVRQPPTLSGGPRPPLSRGQARGEGCCRAPSLSRRTPHADTPMRCSIPVFDPMLAWSNGFSDSFSESALIWRPFAPSACYCRTLTEPYPRDRRRVQRYPHVTARLRRRTNPTGAIAEPVGRAVSDYLTSDRLMARRTE
jgi:hypothetical protein